MKAIRMHVEVDCRAVIHAVLAVCGITRTRNATCVFNNLLPNTPRGEGYLVKS